MEFLTPEELSTHIYAEVIDQISNSDSLKVKHAIDAAIGEAKGYMSRFDTAAVFGKQNEERDPILLMYLKDIAVWHFIVIANPNIDMELRKSRYDAALSYFTRVQAGRIVPEHWPLKEPTEKQSYFQYGSNPRRRSHY